MPDETTTDATAQTTPDAVSNNTGADATGAGTDTAQQTQAQTEKTFTQADVDRIVANRLKTAVRAELKKLTSDDPDKPNVEDLQRQLSESDKRASVLEAKETVRDYLGDTANKLNIRAENMRAIEKLVMAELEYSDDGKPSNIKEAVTAVKNLAPTLFVNSSASINAGNGRNNAVPTGGMDALIRRAAGHGA